MRTRPLPALSARAALAAPALAPVAAAAPPLPFGHVCAPREGALSCPTELRHFHGALLQARSSPGERRAR